MSRRGTIRADSRSVPVTWLDPVAGSPIEIAVGGLFLTAGALIAMVWGAAWLSSLLVTGQAAELSVGDAAVATARLGRNQLSWDGVWSAEIDAALAGPRWFWLFFAIEALLVALLFWPAWRLLGPRPAEPMAVVIEEKAPTHPRKAQREQARRAQAEARAARLAATAATGADPGPPPAAPTAGKIVVDGPTGTRLVLGRVGDTLVATEKHHSVLALGPTRSGKTSGLALPGLLEWAGPALVISAKSDLITMAWKARSKREGRTWLYDPTSSMANASTDDKRSFQGNQWSPLHVIAAVPQPRNEPELDRRVKQWSLSRRSAAWLVGSARTAAEPGGASGGDARFVAAEQLLAPLLLAAAAEERPIDQVVAWVDRRDLGAVRSALDRTGVAEALASWESAHRYDDATTTAAYQILTSALFPFGDPVVAAQAQEPEISARALLDGDPNTLFVLATPHQQGRLRPVVNTLVQEVFEAATAAATVTASARSARPLLIVIDDAAACLSAELVEQMAGRGAGMGIQLLTMFQDLSQVGQIHGSAAATHLADSHRARVVLPGITDPFTLDYLNTVIRGNRLIDPEGDHGADDDGIVSATASWMRTLDDHSAVLVYGNLAPIRLRLRPWFGDQELRDRLVPPTPHRRRLRLPAWLHREPADHEALRGFPNPLDSDANDREAARYWEAVVDSGTLPEAMEFNDGSTEPGPP